VEVERMAMDVGEKVGDERVGVAMAGAFVASRAINRGRLADVSVGAAFALEDLGTN
jgi:hypothetical protein